MPLEVRPLDNSFACEVVRLRLWELPDDQRVGDALLRDLGFTMHRREPFDPSARRLTKRTTMFLSRERHIVPEGGLAAAA